MAKKTPYCLPFTDNLVVCSADDCPAFLSTAEEVDKVETVKGFTYRPGHRPTWSFLCPEHSETGGWTASAKSRLKDKYLMEYDPRDHDPRWDEHDPTANY
jgi:hypothetical protein